MPHKEAQPLQIRENTNFVLATLLKAVYFLGPKYTSISSAILAWAVISEILTQCIIQVRAITMLETYRL